MPPSANVQPDHPTPELEAPVALFVFNRTETTTQVFAAIRRARPRMLLVIADGPRPHHEADKELCRNVRKIVTDLDWPCDLRTNFSDRNLGCRLRVASGLSWVFDQVDRAIILEDDCLPHPTFFSFCAELLSRYQDDPRIGMIAGTNYQVRTSGYDRSYFASRHFSIWGWATWRRAFSGYDLSMGDWRQGVSPTQIRPAASHLRMHWLHLLMFDLAVYERLNSWAIPWSFHLARKTAVSLVPTCNLISNIGVAGTRGRVGDNNNFLSVAPITVPLSTPERLMPNEAYDRFVTRRHRLVRDWLRARMAGGIRRMLGRHS